jgi:hypothetical protein
MVYWPSYPWYFDHLLMEYWPPYTSYFDLPAYLLIRNGGVKIPWGFNLQYKGGQFSIRRFNIAWMEIDPGVNLPWGKFTMGFKIPYDTACLRNLTSMLYSAAVYFWCIKHKKCVYIPKAVIVTTTVYVFFYYQSLIIVTTIDLSL